LSGGRSERKASGCPAEPTSSAMRTLSRYFKGKTLPSSARAGVSTPRTTPYAKRTSHRNDMWRLLFFRLKSLRPPGHDDRLRRDEENRRGCAKVFSQRPLTWGTLWAG